MSLHEEFNNMRELSTGSGKQNEVVIYQMGKVGSQSLRKAIEDSGLRCISLYSLGTPTLAKISKGIPFNNKKMLFLSGFRQGLYSMMLSRGPKRKIITVVRDPIARDISLLYFFLSAFIYGRIGQSTGDEFSLQELIQNIYDENLIHASACSWFDEEFSKTLKVNLFAHPFDKEKGCEVIETPKYSILVLTQEKMNRNESAIRDFLEVEEFRLPTANSAVHKWYSDIYEITKDRIRIDPAAIDKAYSSRYARHFYTEEDLDRQRAMWNIGKVSYNEDI